MSGSELLTVPTAKPRLRPATAEELLDREEALAIQGIVDSVQHLGDDVLEETDLRARIRRHPFLATGLGALAGYFGGPLVLRAVKGALPLIALLPSSKSSGSRTLSGHVLASLRNVYARK